MESKPDKDLLLTMISGAIGEELAASFLGFKEVESKLPNIDEILDAKTSQVPEETSALHILCTSLTMRVDEESSSLLLDNLLKYTLNLPGEFAVMIVQDLRERNIELDYLKSWPLWIKNFNSLLH